MGKSVAIITRYFTFQNSPSILSETPSFTATNSHNGGELTPSSRRHHQVKGEEEGFRTDKALSASGPQREDR